MTPAVCAALSGDDVLPALAEARVPFAAGIYGLVRGDSS